VSVLSTYPSNAVSSLLRRLKTSFLSISFENELKKFQPWFDALIPDWLLRIPFARGSEQSLLTRSRTILRQARALVTLRAFPGSFTTVRKAFLSSTGGVWRTRSSETQKISSPTVSKSCAKRQDSTLPVSRFRIVPGAWGLRHRSFL
jgi:hypothetical protein